MLRAQFVPVIQALPPELVPQTTGGWLDISEATPLIAELNATKELENITCSEFHASVVLPPWRRTWEATKQNPVMGLLLRRCSPEQLAQVEANMHKHLVGLSGGDDAPVILHSVCNLVTATKR